MGALIKTHETREGRRVGTELNPAVQHNVLPMHDVVSWSANPTTMFNANTGEALVCKTNTVVKKRYGIKVQIYIMPV